MTNLVFWVGGEPVSQGSHVARQRGSKAWVVPVNDKELKAWRKVVTDAAIEALARAPEFDTEAEAYSVYTRFCLRRPRYHYYADGRLREDAPGFREKRPDEDKLTRAVGDALSDAGVWGDDSRVVARYSNKAYEDERGPGVWVVVRPRRALAGVAELRFAAPPRDA